MTWDWARKSGIFWDFLVLGFWDWEILGRNAHPPSHDAPQAGECALAVATCNIDANQNQAPAKSESSNSNNEKSMHLLISFSMPNASSKNPEKRAAFHSMVQCSLMQRFQERGYRYQVN